jgi:hypothetical protein
MATMNQFHVSRLEALSDFFPSDLGLPRRKDWEVKVKGCCLVILSDLRVPLNHNKFR